MVSHAKRAKKLGLPFDLCENDFEIPAVCPLLKIPLYVAIGKKTHRHNSPTLDRIDNVKGYVKGNVWVISQQANSMKGEMSVEEVMALTTEFEHG